MNELQTLREQLDRQEAELRLLDDFNAGVSTCQSRLDVAQLLAEKARHLCQAQSLVVFLNQAGELAPVVTDTPHHQRLQDSHLMGLSEPIIEESWARQQSIQTRETTSQDRIFSDEENVAAFCLGDQGLLYLGSQSQKSLLKSSRKLFAALARQAELALISVGRLQSLDDSLVKQKKVVQELEAWVSTLESFSRHAPEFQSTLAKSELSMIAERAVAALFESQTFSLILGEDLLGVTPPDALREKMAALGRPLLLGAISESPLPPLKEGEESLLMVQSQESLLMVSSPERGKFQQRDLRIAHLFLLQFESSWRSAQLHSDVVEAYQKLEESELHLVQQGKMAAVGQLAAGVAHELNTPLATILLESEGLQLEFEDDQEVKESLETVVGEAIRAREIVASLLYYSRDAAKGDKPTELNRVVRDTERLIGSQLRQAGVEVELKLTSEELKFRGNGNEVQQILLNLLLNTRDALSSTSSPEVWVETQKTEESVEVLVCDNGPGVKPEDRDRIFEPFFTTKAVGKGTGLGLSVSSRFAERHGGSLALVSGETGCCFRLALPRLKEE